VTKERWPIIITEWGLASFFELRKNQAFTHEEYRTVIRPRVLLLRDGYPSQHPELAPNNNKSWSVATGRGGIIQYAYKMKWHNLNGGKTKQLRLCIVIYDEQVFLCSAYTNKDAEAREMAKLKIHVQKIREGSFTLRGTL